MGADLTENNQETSHDVKRLTQLEGELRKLLVAVDERLPDPDAPPVIPKRPLGERGNSWTDHAVTWDLNHFAVLAGIAVLLVAAGWVGSSMLYSGRLASQVEDELRPYAVELAETVTSIQTDLVPKLTEADELKAVIDQARRDLLSRDEEFETTLVAAQGQLLNIRDTAIDEIERRLTDQTDDLSIMLDMLRQRAVDLDQGLNEVTQALSAFDHQLPVLTDGFAEVAAMLVESRTMMERTTEEVAALDGKAPPLLRTLDKHQVSLDGGTKTLAILQTQLEALKTQTGRSSRQLEQVLDEGRSQIINWEAMDREVDVRKQEIMQSLDLYADSLNSHVREFLEVLNDETVFTGG
ncbi:MAG: hypothetical protein ACR2Q4_15190 [Geminicoccaceae bacterium]